MIANFFRSLAGAVAALSVYSAAAMSFGAAVGLVAFFFGYSAWPAFALGFFLAIGPIHWYFSSQAQLRKRLDEIRRLKDDKQITEREYHLLRKAAVRWYGERQFGRAEAEPPEGAEGPQNPSAKGKEP